MIKMKVKLKQLVANPYRDIKNYPIDQEKINSLKDSIETTGFWDNILARSHNGKIQIAYGHHRLAVLNLLYDGEHVIDIPVKELTDWDMLLIMGNENRDTYKSSATATLEIVSKVRERLNKQLQEYATLKEFEFNVGEFANIKLFEHERNYQNVRKDGAGRGTIHLVLNRGNVNGQWKEWEVRQAVKTLDDETITTETVKKIGDSTSLQVFQNATKGMTKQQKSELALDIEELNLGKRTIPVYVNAIKTLDEKSKSHRLSDAQNAVLYVNIKQKFAKGESVNTDEVTQMVMEKAHPPKFKQKKQQADKKVLEFTEFLTQTMGEFDLMYKKIKVLNDLRSELTNYSYDDYTEKVAFMFSVEKLRNRLNVLIKNVGDDLTEKSKSEFKNLLNK